MFSQPFSSRARSREPAVTSRLRLIERGSPGVNRPGFSTSLTRRAGAAARERGSLSRWSGLLTRIQPEFAATGISGFYPECKWVEAYSLPSSSSSNFPYAKVMQGVKRSSLKGAQRDANACSDYISAHVAATLTGGGEKIFVLAHFFFPQHFSRTSGDERGQSP